MNENEQERNKQIVEAFCYECLWAWIVYDQYKKLFEKGEPRLNLLSRVALTFFKDLNTVLKHYLLLQICKLTDPAKSCGNKNLSINHIVECLPWPDDIKKQLGSLAKELDAFREDIKSARDKIFSHNDLKTFIENRNLGEFSEGAEKTFWENLQKFVNIIYWHYFEGPFPINVVSEYDADDLIVALKKAVDYDEYFEDKQAEKLQRRMQMTFGDA